MEVGPFPLELDPFISTELNSLDLSDITEWGKLATELLNEHQADRQLMIENFRGAVLKDEELSKWVEKDVDRCSSCEFYTRFLRAGSWQMEPSLKVMRSFCELGKSYPAIISLASPKQLDSVWKNKLNTILETRDSFGRRVYIFRLGVWDPATTPTNEFYASAFLYFYLMSKEVKTQIAGVTVIADITNFGLKHISCLGLEQIKCIAALLTGSVPVWFRRIHVVHHPRVFNILYKMIKPFLVPRVKENIVFHGSDFTELHKEVPQNILPDFLGGSGDLDNTGVVTALKHMEEELSSLRSQMLEGAQGA